MQRQSGPLIRPAGPRRPTRQEIARRRVFVALAVVLVVLLVWFVWPKGDGTEPTGGATPGNGNGGNGNGNGNGGVDPGTIVPGENPIEHVVFLVKENRSFDHYFGTLSRGERGHRGWHDELRERAPDTGSRADSRPGDHPPRHGRMRSILGFSSINGGEMNGYNIIGEGERSLRLRDALAGRRSRRTGPTPTGSCSPTCSSRRCTDRRSPSTSTRSPHSATASSTTRRTTDTEGNYCDDPEEFTKRFPLEDLRSRRRSDHEAGAGDHEGVPDQLYRIASYWEDTRTCIDIHVLPDLLEKTDISWKYYANPDVWMNALQAIRHVRFGPMWQRVQPPETFLQDVKAGELPAVSWLIPPEGDPNEHPGSGADICKGENWTIEYVNALMKCDTWASTAVIIVWDDFGGFYDHVVPPHYDMMGLGPRTPALILSPWTRRATTPRAVRSTAPCMSSRRC